MLRRSSASICGTSCESASLTQKLSMIWCSSSQVCSFLMRRYSDSCNMMTLDRMTSAFMMRWYHAGCLPCSLPFKLLSQLNVTAWPRHCLFISLTSACACRPQLSVWQCCFELQQLSHFVVLMGGSHVKLTMQLVRLQQVSLHLGKHVNLLLVSDCMRLHLSSV